MAIQIDAACEAASIRDRIVAWRRDFHRFPELGFQEHRSSQTIARVLGDLGYEVQTQVAHTGVVGLLRGQTAGPVVMLRFDMDALPIQEQNETDYVSQNDGVMHACGHDAHMAIGLGVATIVARHRDEMGGTLKLVFQPGEEGMNGAEVMVAEGVMDNPRPDVFIAAHVWNDLPGGYVDVSPGPVMAAAERWTCMVRGKGGHGAMPHQTVDPVVATASILTALQTIVSRNVSPLESAVVTVGTIHGGEAFNIIPSQVELSGTIRTYNVDVRERVRTRLLDVCKGIAGAYGARAEVAIEGLSPAVVNDAGVASIVRSAAEKVLGVDRVSSIVKTTGSEDASFFMQEVPSCFFFIGSGDPERGVHAPHHNPRFDVNEAALSVGVAVFTQALSHYL